MSTDMMTIAEAFPTLSEARLWSRFRMSGGPFTKSDFNRYAAHGFTEEEINRINKLRCLTTSGHYIRLWVNFVRYAVWAVFHWKAYKNVTTA